MGRASPRLASFCLNRLTTRVRVRSPPIEHSKPISGGNKSDLSTATTTTTTTTTVRFSGPEAEKNAGEGTTKAVGFVAGRRIMIVVDSSQEAKSAVHWALTHTVQSQDTVVLLYVTRSAANPGGEVGDDQKGTNPRGYEILSSIKNTCQMKKPGLEVEIVSAEGKEKGPTIVEAAKKQGISLLVLGHRKRPSMTWRLLMTWARSKIAGGGTVEYCIQKAECMTVAVRRKSRKLGGYLITTKRHKDFWLLA
ncbi:hypothetical protein H6P81_018672 [Aristolochia fimbriata]|uniref:UspA domain-containing protein n=1 Tax=Aristolochia fimbriata TaxID=158543 RepID=A0AAV7E620_ARIFI|nr:hypothetical protein H6P81_018672 [Aristolochia fimbriata]